MHTTARSLPSYQERTRLTCCSAHTYVLRLSVLSGLLEFECSRLGNSLTQYDPNYVKQRADESKNMTRHRVHKTNTNQLPRKFPLFPP